MAKNKAKNKANAKAVTNRPAYSRVSFLYQAAALLATIPQSEDGQPRDGQPQAQQQQQQKQQQQKQQQQPLHNMSSHLLSQMRSVAQKTNMRLRPTVKRSVCKYCDTLLVEGETCSSTVENKSKPDKNGCQKPWADLLAVQCQTCGRVRRYPVAAPRQPRRPFRGGGNTDDGSGKKETEGSRKGPSKQPENRAAGGIPLLPRRQLGPG